ncbi:MAG TPA: tRNA epoxyqueuosine(34) reductase QueG [Candidatus Saccharimonadia bacterium]|nr:tRNA epoxyqueuosine(34) reductase QueG [Candidatus Saccharimonadia bacterium]
MDAVALAADVKRWAHEAGFQRVGIAGVELESDEARLLEWLERGMHGSMDYMARHGTSRSRPDELVPGTLRVVSVGLDYLPPDAADMEATLADPTRAYVSRYALGRDYHKLVRTRLQGLADRIAAAIGPFGYRAFADSAPVLEKPLARNAGLGFIGKHTNLIDKDGGSWFFLGELYTNLPLPVDAPASAHCGTCTRCIDVCPTRAIVAPYSLDARRCISYLTIESRDAIPHELRPLIGNRIYGCDDCQLVCPWNKFARTSVEPDFAVRHGLDRAGLVELFAWDEAQFLRNTEGSAIRRIGHESWLRNIAVALGNAPTTREIVAALESRLDHPSPLVREHVAWALSRHAAAITL